MAHVFRGMLREEAGAFVEVPPDVLAALGPRKRPAVRVVINGVELRTTLASMADFPFLELFVPR